MACLSVCARARIDSNISLHWAEEEIIIDYKFHYIELCGLCVFNELISDGVVVGNDDDERNSVAGHCCVITMVKLFTPCMWTTCALSQSSIVLYLWKTGQLTGVYERDVVYGS